MKSTTTVLNCLAVLAGVLLVNCLLTLPQVGCQEEVDPDEVPICRTEDELIPHPNCTKYYQCTNFVPFERICSGEGSLYWNPRNNECDFPFNVPECVGGTRPPIGEPEPTTEMMTGPTVGPIEPTTMPEMPTTGAPPTPDPSICDDPSSAYYIPDENDDTCRNYIFCFYGAPIPLYCAPDLVFDPAEQKCVRPESYECPARQTTTTSTTTTTTTTTTTEPPSTPAPTDPPADPTTEEEPNPTTVTPAPVTEVETTMVPPETSTTDMFPCPADLDFIYMPHHESCHLFYLCIRGEFRGILTCGDDQWFDNASQGCVVPEHSDCPLKQLA